MTDQMQQNNGQPVVRSLKLRAWESKLLRVLVIASSLYLALVFIGVIPVHCDAYHPAPLTPAQLEAARQAELYAASSKAIEQVFCNEVLLLTGTTGKIMMFTIIFGLFLGTRMRPVFRKLVRRLRKAH